MKPIAAKPTARAPDPKLRMLVIGAIVAPAALDELDDAVPEGLVEAAVADVAVEAELVVAAVGANFVGSR